MKKLFENWRNYVVESDCDNDEELEEAIIDEAEICKAGKDWVDGKTIGGQKVSRGEDGKFNNWSARAAQIASKYCKDPNYGRGKKKKNEAALTEGDLGDWEKENWTHSDGTPCGGGDKDGSQSRCKPASKWKTMSKGEKAADNAKKKAGTKSGKQYVSATKKGKVTKAHTKESLVAEVLSTFLEGGCGEPAPVDYDHGPESSMHRGSLHTIRGEVEQLLSMIGEQDDLPEWLEAKITKARAYLSAAKDYLSAEQAQAVGALEEALSEKLNPKDGAGSYVEDFYDSDAPQFKGKSKEKKRQMAIAAYLQDKEEAGLNEGTDYRVGDYVRIVQGGLRGAAGKVIELVPLITGEPGLVVLLDTDADKRVFGQAGDEMVVAMDKVQPPVGQMRESDLVQERAWTEGDLTPEQWRALKSIADGLPPDFNAFRELQKMGLADTRHLGGGKYEFSISKNAEQALVDIMDEDLEEAAKCTGPTKKASSDAKGKKWMKCVKSDSGGYKRIHWGQKGVRVTGKSGDTKRKKSFKARHNCSKAKSNTPQGQACKDWA